jgi:hypothetical protein
MRTRKEPNMFDSIKQKIPGMNQDEKKKNSTSFTRE